MKNMANYLSAMLFEYIKKTRFIKKNFLNFLKAVQQSLQFTRCKS